MMVKKYRDKEIQREICFQSPVKLDLKEMARLLCDRKSYRVLPMISHQEDISISLCGQEERLVREFRSIILRPSATARGYCLRLEEGSLVYNGNEVLHQHDVYVCYEHKNARGLKALLAEITASQPLVLAEPDVGQRFKQQQGNLDFVATSADAFGTNSPASKYLLWQLYLVNQGWSDFLCKPLERVTLRQLRVKIRRLRSCMAFFKPVLEQEGAVFWQNRMRKQGEVLSLLRELDVALMATEKIRQQKPPSMEEQPERLAGLFRRQRQEEALRLKKKLDLSEISLEMAELLLWLRGETAKEAYAAGMADISQFLWERIKQWSRNLSALTKKYPDFSNIDELHKIRIKVKRFRYVMMTLPEINRNTGSMLRKLKRLQDVLGFLHDEYVNGQLVKEIVAGGDEELRYEAALFTGWEGAKIQEASRLLPDLWEDFCEELEIWQETV